MMEAPVEVLDLHKFFWGKVGEGEVKLEAGESGGVVGEGESALLFVSSRISLA